MTFKVIPPVLDSHHLHPGSRDVYKLFTTRILEKTHSCKPDRFHRLALPFGIPANAGIPKRSSRTSDPGSADPKAMGTRPPMIETVRRLLQPGRSVTCRIRKGSLGVCGIIGALDQANLFSNIDTSERGEYVCANVLLPKNSSKTVISEN